MSPFSLSSAIARASWERKSRSWVLQWWGERDQGLDWTRTLPQSSTSYNRAKLNTFLNTAVPASHAFITCKSEEIRKRSGRERGEGRREGKRGGEGRGGGRKRGKWREKERGRGKKRERREGEGEGGQKEREEGRERLKGYLSVFIHWPKLCSSFQQQDHQSKWDRQIRGDDMKLLGTHKYCCIRTPN